MKKGYLKEAVINYIALLAGRQRARTRYSHSEELVKNPDIHGLSKSPAIFDPAKLKAINGKYIKAMTPEKFAEYAILFISSSPFIES